MEDDLKEILVKALEAQMPSMIQRIAELLAPCLDEVISTQVRAALAPLRSAMDQHFGALDETRSHSIVREGPKSGNRIPKLANGQQPSGTSLAVLEKVVSSHPTPVARREVVQSLRPARASPARIKAVDNAHLKAIRRLVSNGILLLSGDAMLQLREEERE